MNTELTVVVPTYNERNNVRYLFDSLCSALAGISWEVIFVDDDSVDDTSSLIREMAREDPRVRCIQRLKRRGLSSACMEGMLASSSLYICIMDADLQHDEKLLPSMLSAMKTENLDLVIGSRYIESGSVGNLSRYRVFVSRLATLMGKLLLISDVKDPMSGFFMLRRNYFEQIMHDLSGRGFKILLDILASTHKQIRFKEIPYIMRSRFRGASKLDSTVIWDFFALMLNKFFGRILPVRFLLFSAVGLVGVLIHIFSLWTIYKLLGTGFLAAQIIATYGAMTSNFILNNVLTYRDLKLKGFEFIRGLISFYIYCSFGAFINIVFAGHLFDSGFPWWLAGVLGVISGAVWNYAVTSVLTWRVERP